jgi:hypothetical protein
MATKPITLISENRHGAIIETPSSQSRIFQISHSHIQVKKIVFDGRNVCCMDGIRIFGGAPPAIPLTGILLEDNRVLNTIGHNIIFGANVDGFIFRWNYLRRTINAGSGEAFYMGSASTSGSMSNGQIYANTIVDAGQECWDIKSGGTGNDVHHNICDGSGRLTDSGQSPDGTSNYGPITFVGDNNTFHNNIVKNFKTRSNGGGAVMNYSSATGNIVGPGNVFRNQLSGSRKLAGTGGWSTVKQNTFCSFKSDAISSSTAYTLLSNNGAPGTDAPNSVCDSEEARILSEMQTLPGNPGSTLQSDTQVPIAPSSLTLGARN